MKLRESNTYSEAAYMKKTNELTDWVIRKIENEYKDDVALLIAIHGHNTDDDQHGVCFDYFVPATERGNELAELLREHGTECEYSDDMHVVMMVTGLDKEQIDRIGDVLAMIPVRPALIPDRLFTAYTHDKKMSAREAFLSPCERIPTEAAAGRICAFPVTLCPPGTALITGGEVFCDSDIFFLKKYGILFVNVVK